MWPPQWERLGRTRSAQVGRERRSRVQLHTRSFVTEKRRRSSSTVPRPFLRPIPGDTALSGRTNRSTTNRKSRCTSPRAQVTETGQHTFIFRPCVFLWFHLALTRTQRTLRVRPQVQTTPLLCLHSTRTPDLDLPDKRVCSCAREKVVNAPPADGMLMSSRPARTSLKV
ncbi:hypothetical protein JOB18_006388 [Solea senegalensis]|uniref:Uncharacterized protein n=1 Tax=Solea senegalensis TaxID=28829 RepID=A0AAV6Q9R8_SOLSE|nr:hypothetical protein JOB18_006388 [Solea senegalensis]